MNSTEVQNHRRKLDEKCLCLPYSGKFSLGANFRDFRRQTCFRENKNRKKIHQDGNWWRHYVRTSIRTSTCVNEMVLYSLSAL